MKVTTIFGTRPEIIRLSCVIPLLDRFSEHRLIHTGQNYDPQLSDVFFRELGIRAPDVHLDVGHTPSFAAQAAAILEKTGELLAADRPDRVLLLGDTNSALSAIVAARLAIPVYHMEAGNRCYDDRVPEEINRRIIDHSSTVLMPYTDRSKENLLREGFERERIFVTGNPIFEVLETHTTSIEDSGILSRQGVKEGQYFLATLHRVENVDEPSRLSRLLEALSRVARDHRSPMLVSLHPRTADRMKQFGLGGEGLRLLEPLGLFDFVKLEKHAKAVLSDSGTVQEECAIFGVPNVTLRDVTERAETIECGSNIIGGSAVDAIGRALAVALATGGDWTPPREYTARRVSRTVAKIVLGETSVRSHK